MSRRIYLSGLLVLSALIAACRSPDEGASPFLEQEDSAGTQVVRVLRGPADTVRLNMPAVRIGSVGVGGDEHEVFDLLTDLVLLPGGRIAVVDNRGARVALFDSTGEWLYDIGGRGKGPGEYTAPIYASTRGDTLFLWDALQRRLSRYTAEGTVLGSTSLPKRASAHPFAAVAGGYVHEVESGQLMDPAPARGALIRTGRDGESVDTLVGPYLVPEVGWVVTDEESGSGHMTNPPALGISPPWTTTDRHLVWLDPTRAEVEIRGLADGGLERLIRLPYAAAPPSDRDRNMYFQGLQAQFGFPDDMIARERERTEFVERRPPVAGVLADERGRVWVAAHDPGAQGRDYIGSGWDVIDVDQEAGMRVELPADFELRIVRGRRVYGITTLESGVHVVDVFRFRDDQ